MPTSTLGEPFRRVLPQFVYHLPKLLCIDTYYVQSATTYELMRTIERKCFQLVVQKAAGPPGQSSEPAESSSIGGEVKGGVAAEATMRASDLVSKCREDKPTHVWVNLKPAGRLLAQARYYKQGAQSTYNLYYPV